MRVEVYFLVVECSELDRNNLRPESKKLVYVQISAV